MIRDDSTRNLFIYVPHFTSPYFIADPFFVPKDKLGPKGVPLTQTQRNRMLMELIIACQWEIPPGLQTKPSDAAIDLLRKMLTADPSQRIDREGLLRHPWFLQDLPAGALQLNDTQLAKGTSSAVLQVSQRFHQRELNAAMSMCFLQTYEREAPPPSFLHRLDVPQILASTFLVFLSPSHPHSLTYPDVMIFTFLSPAVGGRGGGSDPRGENGTKARSLPKGMSELFISGLELYVVK